MPYTVAHYFTVMTEAELAAMPFETRPYVCVVPNAHCIGCQENVAQRATAVFRDVARRLSNPDSFYGDEWTEDMETDAELGRGIGLISTGDPTLPYTVENPQPICEGCAVQGLNDPNFTEPFGEELDLSREERDALLLAAEAAVGDRFRRFRETGLVEPWSLDALKRRLVAEFPRPLERRRAVPIETLLERGSPPAPWSSSSSACVDRTGSGDG
jgi:hypothetical protein